jgi:hypothetical protein
VVVDAFDVAAADPSEPQATISAVETARIDALNARTIPIAPLPGQNAARLSSNDDNSE